MAIATEYSLESNSVFISYRRDISGYTARAVFQDLRTYGIDTFLDINSIDRGQFEPIILKQIAARPYFLLILAPGCLERCIAPNDWLRREIEHALDLNRIIVPLLTSDFSFNSPYSTPYLTGKLLKLSSYNGIRVPLDFFEEAMERIRLRFLKPISLYTTQPSPEEQAIANKKIAQVSAMPAVTELELNSQSHVERALSYVNDPDRALVELNEAIRLNPQFADAYIIRASFLQLKGEIKSALADLDEAIHIDEFAASAYFARGAIRHDIDDKRGALVDLNEAIRLDPTLSLAYSIRGSIKDDTGDEDGALVDFNEALKLNPQDTIAYFNRGLVRRIKNDVEGAIADFSEVIRLYPENVEAYYHRGELRGNKGETEGAITDFGEAIRLKPSEPLFYRKRGFVYSSIGNNESAIADFTEAIRQDPQDAEAYYNRGVTYSNKKDHDRAIADYSEAIKYDPESAAEAYFNRGVTYNLKGEISKATADLRRAIELNPDLPNAEKIREYIVGLETSSSTSTKQLSTAEEYYQKGESRSLHDYDGRIADFTEAIRLNPKFWRAYFKRAMAYAMKGNTFAAQADTEESIRLSKEEADSQKKLTLNLHKREY